MDGIVPPGRHHVPDAIKDLTKALNTRLTDLCESHAGRQSAQVRASIHPMGIARVSHDRHSRGSGRAQRVRPGAPA
jgi:hypothetical protein